MHAAVERFLAECGEKWADSTVDRYRRYVTYFVEWCCTQGVERPEDVDTSTIREWLSTRNWGASSRYVAIYALRNFFAWAVGKANSPAERVVLPKRRRKPQRTLTRETYQALISSIDTSTAKGIRDLAIIELLLDTGLRARELCELRLDHMRPDERVLVAKTKGGSWEPGVYSIYTAMHLSGWLAIRPVYAVPSAETVFVSLGGIRRGTGLTVDGLRVILRKISKKAGVGLVSPHDFRRTFATFATKAGNPSRVVQLLGRWGTISWLEHYTQALQVKPELMDGKFPVEFAMGLDRDEGQT